MLKSAITTTTMLGFTLMTSLIMLVSFASMNIFSNAIAQEYDNYYEDRYYEKSNFNTYKYNNEEKYSDYPSKVNKYECQKGPFEGFFVSSPEFCILKNTPTLNCEKCIEYYLNFALDRNDVNRVLDGIRTALDLPLQGNIPTNNPLDLTKGADLWEICDALEEKLNTSITDNNALILNNILQTALDALPDPLPGSPPTPHPIPDPFYSSIGIVNAIFDCIAEQLNLVIPSS